MTTPPADPNVPLNSGPVPTSGHDPKERLRDTVERLRRSVRERWEWYRQQQAEDTERHWWDVYNR